MITEQDIELRRRVVQIIGRPKIRLAMYSICAACLYSCQEPGGKKRYKCDNLPFTSDGEPCPYFKE